MSPCRALIEGDPAWHGGRILGRLGQLVHFAESTQVHMPLLGWKPQVFTKPAPPVLISLWVMAVVRSLSQSPGDRGCRGACSGRQGRNVLSLAMADVIKQIYCCHWDLGELRGVYGVAGH